MTIILAKIMSLYLLVCGSACMLNPDYFREIYIGSISNKMFPLIGGILSTLVGAVFISIHNEWVMSWPLIITLVGWWSLVKGFILLSCSNAISSFSFLEKRSNRFYRLTSLTWILAGLFFAAKGWS